MRKLKIYVAVAAVFVSACATTGQRPETADNTQGEATGGDQMKVERWQGLLKQGINQIEFVVEFTERGEETSATFALPNRGIEGIPLRGVEFNDTELVFELHKPANPQYNERYKLQRSPDGAQSASGTVSLGAATLPVKMRLIPEGQAFSSWLKRPQTPSAPYPYEVREVTFTNPSDGTKRAGTLTLPKNQGSSPAVIIESGSGAVDRDGSLSGHKSYWVIADHLTRQGIAVLRVDDRGVGGSTGNEAMSSYQDLTNDLLAGVAFLKEQPGIDASKIGLMGHSQGATIAPMAAVQSKDVAFVIMLCGMGVPGDEVLYRQKEMILMAHGVGGAPLDAIMAQQRKLLDAVIEGATPPQLRAVIEEGLKVEVDPISLAAMPPESKKALVDRGVASVSAKVIQELIKNQPATYLTKLDVPAFAVFAQKDQQVEASVNSAAMQKLMAGNKRATTWIVPKMSHNFQTTETGNVEELATIEESVKPLLLERLAAWILEETKAP